MSSVTPISFACGLKGAFDAKRGVASIKDGAGCTLACLVRRNNAWVFLESDPGGPRFESLDEAAAEIYRCMTAPGKAVAV